MTRTRLYKSRADKMLFGVCGGLADYFNVDPVLVRIAFVVLTVAGGSGILLYLILAILMPQQETSAVAPGDIVKENLQSITAEAAEAGRRGVETVSGALGRETARPETAAPDERRNTLAVILIGVGVLLLLANLGLFSWFDWDTFWPLLLILLGVAVIVGRFGRGG